MSRKIKKRPANFYKCVFYSNMTNCYDKNVLCRTIMTQKRFTFFFYYKNRIDLNKLLALNRRKMFCLSRHLPTNIRRRRRRRPRYLLFFRSVAPAVRWLILSTFILLQVGASCGSIEKNLGKILFVFSSIKNKK